MIDWSTLTERFKGRTTFIRKLANTALDTHADSPDKLRRLVRDRDFEGLAFVAHSIKGLAGNLAATSTQELAATTEKAARDNDDHAYTHASLLADQIDMILGELGEFKRSNP
jgi:HPt (histidine-containing phosphotransfer) domain-containing protein